MKLTPADVQRQIFSARFRGFDKDEVRTFLAAVAEEMAGLQRDKDHVEQQLRHLELIVNEHRERESILKNTLLTAQRLSGELKEAAGNEAKLILREAQGRADMLLQKTQVRLEELDHDINELRLRRRDAEGSVESTIQALYRALEFIRDQDQARSSDDKLLLHRPRQADQAPAAPKPLLEERKASS